MARGSSGDNFVITIGMQASTGNTDAVFALTAKNAEKLGKAIGNALQFDNKATSKSLNTINDDLKKLATTATSVRNSFKSFSDFPYKQTQNNIQAVAKSLGALGDTSVRVSNQMKQVKFLIGDSNKNIKSVISNLENLEKVANRVSNRVINVGTGGSSGSKSSSGSTASSEIPISPRAQEQFYGPQMVSTATANTAATKGLVNAGAESLKRLAGMTADVDKAMASAAKKSGGDAVKALQDTFKKIPSIIEDTGKQSQSRFSTFFSATFFADVLYNGLRKGIEAFKDLSVETVLYAARTQELQVVLQSLAKVHDISTQEIANQEEAIKRLNITTQDASETLAKFINVGFDIKSAGPLARVAQDLAVIGNKNTSEELNQLVIAIQTLQSRNLRNAGVFLTVDEVLDKLSATTGRARDSFSTLEKQQAVLNAVMDYGGRVAGTYQAALGTTAKQLRSLDRQFKEAENSVGQDFVDSLGLAVQAASGLLLVIAKYPDVFLSALTTVGLLSAALISLKTALIETAVVNVAGVFGGLTSLGKELANQQTLQQTLLAEKSDQLAVERLNLEALQEELVKTAARVELEGALTAELERQYAIKGKALESSLVRNAAQTEAIATQGVGAAVASGVGQLLGVLAILGVIYTIGKGIYDVVTAPYTVGTLDINAIKKEADDTRVLQDFYNKSSTTAVNIKKDQVDITGKLTDGQQVSLDLANKETDATQKRLDILKAVGAQIELNNSKGNINIAAAGTNIFQAGTNFQASDKQVNYLDNLFESNKSLSGTVTTGEFGDQVTGGINPDQILSNRRKQIEQRQKDEAVLIDTLKQGKVVAEAYGKSLDDIINAGIEERFKGDAKGADDFRKSLQPLIDQLNSDAFKSIKEQFQSPDDRIAGFAKNYNEGLLKQIEAVKQQQLDDYNKFVSQPGGVTDEESQKRIEQMVKNLQSVPEIYAESFGRDKANVQAFTGSIVQGLTQLERSGKALTYGDKIKYINDEVAKHTELSSGYIGAVLSEGQAYKDNTDLVNSYLTSTSHLKGELKNANVELSQFTSQNAEQRDLGNQIQKSRDLLTVYKNISQLEFQLGKSPTDLNRFGNDAKSARDYENTLKRQLKLQDSITEAKHAQRDLEDDINALKIKATIPAINAELLIQKSILDTIISRKTEEQQLTADIAVEIDKRTKYGIDSNRLVAGVFLDAQREEASSQSDFVKSYVGKQLATGNTGVFDRNPIIQNAVKQADKLTEIEKKGGLQVVKIDEGNQIAIKTQSITQTIADKLDTFNGSVTTAIASVAGAGASGGVGGIDYSRPAQGTGFDKIYNAFVGQESGGNPFKPNARTGATGLGQILPKYFQSYANLAGMPNTTFQQYKQDPHVQQAIVFNALKALYPQALKVANGNPNEAIRALASRWYSGSFTKANNYNRFNANEPSIGEYSDNVLRRAGGVVSSRTQLIEQGARSATPTTPTTIDTQGLSKEDISQIVGGKKFKGSVDQINSMLLTAKALKDAFGRVTGSEADIEAGTAYNKDMAKRAKDIDLSKANRAINNFNAKAINATNTKEAWEKYHTETNQEGNFGAQTRDTNDKINTSRLTSLRTPGSVFYNQAYGEANSKRIEDQISLEKELISLQAEGDYRRTKTADYLDNQSKKFYQAQTQQTQSLQDQEVQLDLTRKAFADKNSSYSLNLIRQENLERDKAREQILEQIDAEKRYTDVYIASGQQRSDFEKQLESERLKDHNTTLDEITKSEIRTNNILFGLEDRLRLTRQQYEEQRAKAYEDNLNKQVQSELEYQRKTTEDFNKDEFRTSALDKLTTETKSTTDLMVGLWNDSFDAINNGIGGLLDKATSKMGVFGQTISNLLKGIFGNILSTIGHRLLDNLFPAGSVVSGVLSGSSSSKNTIGLDDAAKNAVKGVAGLDKVGGVITDASASASGSMLYLAQAAGAAAQALLAIAGQVGATGVNIQNTLINSGKTGGSTSAANAILSATNSGVSGVQSATNGLTSSGVISGQDYSDFYTSSGINPSPIFASQTVSGSSGSGLGGSVLHEIGNTVSGSASKSGGSILSKLGLGNIGKQLLASAPALGAGLGGALGGPSAVGGILGQLGGGIAGTLGSSLGLAALSSTGISGALGSGAGSIGILGLSGIATLGIGAAIAGAFLIGSYLFGRAKRRKVEKANVTQWSTDALKQMQDLLQAVKTDKTDGASALSSADDIITQFQAQVATLKTKPGKALAAQQLQQLQVLRGQIQAAAAQQQIRQELNTSIVPTYATGGVASSSLIRVSKGETLYPPSSAAMLGHKFSRAGVPGYASGGVSAFHIPGTFDGRDNIYMRVPVGTVIANPRQQSSIASGYASGGATGRITAPAAHAVTVQAPPVNAIIVMSPEDAKVLASKIPNSRIVDGVRSHVKQTGISGLAGDILNTLSQ